MIKKGYKLSESRPGIEVTPSDLPENEVEETSTSQEGTQTGFRTLTVRYRRGAKARYTIDLRTDELRARIQRANQAMREK